MCPVKSIHLPCLSCSCGCCEEHYHEFLERLYFPFTGTVPSTSPSLFLMPFADMKRAIDPLSYNMLRMELQKGRRTWDPNDTMELLMPALECLSLDLWLSGREKNPLFG